MRYISIVLFVLWGYASIAQNNTEYIVMKSCPKPERGQQGVVECKYDTIKMVYEEKFIDMNRTAKAKVFEKDGKYYRILTSCMKPDAKTSVILCDTDTIEITEEQYYILSGKLDMDNLRLECGKSTINKGGRVTCYITLQDGRRQELREYIRDQVQKIKRQSK